MCRHELVHRHCQPLQYSEACHLPGTSCLAYQATLLRPEDTCNIRNGPLPAGCHQCHGPRRCLDPQTLPKWDLMSGDIKDLQKLVKTNVWLVGVWLILMYSLYGVVCCKQLKSSFAVSVSTVSFLAWLMTNVYQWSPAMMPCIERPRQTQSLNLFRRCQKCTFSSISEQYYRESQAGKAMDWEVKGHPVGNPFVQANSERPVQSVHVDNYHTCRTAAFDTHRWLQVAWCSPSSIGRSAPQDCGSSVIFQ